MRRLLALVSALLATPLSAQPLPDVVAINVLIEPDAPTVTTVQAMNARLRAANPAGYALDASHAPHITLVQRFVRRDDLPRVEAAVAAVVARERPFALELTAQRYTATDFGGGMLMLDMARTAQLDRLAAAMLAAVQPFAVSGGTAAAFVPDPAGPIQPGTVSWVENFASNAAGDKFTPHITIGAAPLPLVKDIAAEPFRSFAFGVRSIALYQLGNYGTAARRLWSAERPR